MYIIIRLVVSTIIFLLPILPAVVFYQGLDTDSLAEVTGQYLGLGIKLGGPLAAYFVLMLTLHRVYERILPKHVVDMQCKQRDIHNTCKLLCGEWSFVSEHHDDNGNTVQTPGVANICTDRKGDMSIHGYWVDENGNRLGHWTADDLIVDSGKLVLMFQVPSPTGLETTGLIRLKLHYGENKRDLLKLTGMWGVLGENIRGRSTWERTPV